MNIQKKSGMKTMETMKKIIEFLKKYIDSILVGLVLIWTSIQIGSCVKSNVLSKENQDLKKQIQLREELIQEKQKDLEEQKKIYQQQILEYDRIIKTEQEHIEQVDSKNSKLNDKIKTLEKDFSNAKTCPEQLKISLKEIEAWKDKFSLSESGSKEKDVIILSLNKKYDSEKKLRISIEEIDKQRQTALADSNKLVSSLESKIHKINLISTIEKIGLGAAIILIILKLAVR